MTKYLHAWIELIKHRFMVLCTPNIGGAKAPCRKVSICNAEGASVENEHWRRRRRRGEILDISGAEGAAAKKCTFGGTEGAAGPEKMQTTE